MGKYYLRLDDASDYMDIRKWIYMEKILDKYKVKPIFGIIPQNADDSLIKKYKRNDEFWLLVNKWITKGWIPAMHGYEHRYVTKDGGINPINYRSEFAGLPYDVQADKIKKGYMVLLEHNVKVDVFFAPSHSFDENTLNAIRTHTPIRIISDTIAWDSYVFKDFIFLPQQCGSVRRLPFGTTTFCYHPNSMTMDMFDRLENFIRVHKNKFKRFDPAMHVTRKQNILDAGIRKLYFFRRKIR